MDKEILALALFALGTFTMDPEGRLWRHRDQDKPITPRRADTGLSRAGGYLRLQFTAEERRHAVGAHRIVWMLTTGRLIPSGMEINHRNGVKSDNRPSNLELVTRAQNAKHSFQELGQRTKDQRGAKNTSAKLDEATILQIRHLRQSGMKQRILAEQFRVSQRTISEICLRKTWRHVP